MGFESINILHVYDKSTTSRSRRDMACADASRKAGMRAVKAVQISAARAACFREILERVQGLIVRSRQRAARIGQRRACDGGAAKERTHDFDLA